MQFENIDELLLLESSSNSISSFSNERSSLSEGINT
jgi:hypothetical protein